MDPLKAIGYAFIPGFLSTAGFIINKDQEELGIDNPGINVWLVLMGAFIVTLAF